MTTNFFYLAHFIVQGKVFSATSVISWQLLLFSLRVSQSPRTRHKCFDALLRVASSALSFSGAARPGSSHRAPGRGRADLAARGRGAAAGTMAARVSPWVEGTRVLETLGEGSFGSVVLARAPVGDGSGHSVVLAMKRPFRRSATRGDILWEADCLRKVAHPHVVELVDVRASNADVRSCCTPRSMHGSPSRL